MIPCSMIPKECLLAANILLLVYSAVALREESEEQNHDAPESIFKSSLRQLSGIQRMSRLNLEPKLQTAIESREASDIVQVNKI